MLYEFVISSFDGYIWSVINISHWHVGQRVSTTHDTVLRQLSTVTRAVVLPASVLPVEFWMWQNSLPLAWVCHFTHASGKLFSSTHASSKTVCHLCEFATSLTQVGETVCHLVANCFATSETQLAKQVFCPLLASKTTALIVNLYL